MYLAAPFFIGSSFCTCSVLGASLPRAATCAWQDASSTQQVLPLHLQSDLSSQRQRCCTRSTATGSCAYLAERLLRRQQPMHLFVVSATATACSLIVCHVSAVTKQSSLWRTSCLHRGALILHTIALCVPMPQACVHLAGCFCTGNSVRQANRQLHSRMFERCCTCGVLSATFAATLVGPIAWQVFVRTLEHAFVVGTTFLF